jgi:hypothetical protein
MRRSAICLGGDNASPLNHWAQPNAGEWDAAAKDCARAHLHRDRPQSATPEALPAA